MENELGPGQNLAELVTRINRDDLSKIIGEDVIDTLEVVAEKENHLAVIRDLTIASLRNTPEELFTRADVRKLIYEAMSHEKLRELANRLEIAPNTVQSIDPTRNRSIWKGYLGFFGLDAREIAPFQSELPVQEVGVQFGLFPHQRNAAQRVWRKLDGDHSRVVLHMPTGAGKTRTAIHVLCRFLTSREPGVVIWLAATRELLDQAADAFTVAWPVLGNREVSLVRLWGDYNGDFKELSDGIVIAGLQKFNAFADKNALDLLRLGSRTKLVIVDEAHQAIAPTYASLINKLVETGSFHSLLGLTATPGRTWSDIAQDEKLSDFFDGNKVMLEVDGWDNPVEYLMAEGYLAKPHFTTITYSPSHELSECLSRVPMDAEELDDSALDRLGEEVPRNKAIIEEVQRLIENGHFRIILFAASVRHAQIISAALFALGIDAPVVTGTTNIGYRRRIINSFKSNAKPPIVLCNYGVLTTGFDAPNTSAAIIARPTKSLVLYSQMVGRATRGIKAKGNETCEISTVVDVNLPGFGDMAEAFTNWEDVWDG
ncbi:DEAD/DEAH box helicase [Roseibium album]|uniref:DEAD/DEAH box helicase n=1 Tax=Roseibium album TaxID=311410 RepID=UPI003BB08523